MVEAERAKATLASLAASLAVHAGVLLLALPWLAAAPAATSVGGQAAVEVEIIAADAYDRMMSEEGAGEAAPAFELPPVDAPQSLDKALTEPVAIELPSPDEPDAPRINLAEVAIPIPPPPPDAVVPPAHPVEVAIPDIPPTPLASLSDWSVPAPVVEKPDVERKPEAPAAPPLRLPPARAKSAPPSKTRAAVRERPEPRPVVRSARGETGVGRDAADSTASLRGGAGVASPQAGAAAFADFRGRVLAHLARHKRFPDQARALRVSGRVAVTFSFDARGRVTNVALAASSGHPVLDQEALAMVRRASPFPVIPPETGRMAASFTAPIRYDLPL
jgi:protein TonB